MTVHWHKRAVAALHQIEQYVLDNYGELERQSFMDEVEHAVISLKDKIVYYIKGDVIHVAAFWDTRREPKNQVRQTP